MIEKYYQRLQKHCQRKFKDPNCEDTVGDFVLKVLTKPNFYPETIKNEDEEWRWTKVCFDRFKIDKLRTEKVRKDVLLTLSINPTGNPSLSPTETTSRFNSEVYIVKEILEESVEIAHDLSDLEYEQHIQAYLTDNILSIYRALSSFDKRIFQLVYFCKYSTIETTAFLKETQVVTKRDVMLALKRIKERLKGKVKVHGS